MTNRWKSIRVTMTVLAMVLVFGPTRAIAQIDPGPRTGAPGAGGPIAGLTLKEAKFFDAGLEEFTEIGSVDGSVPDTEEGLGPRFNMTGCAMCHAQPAVGGTSPAVNPQVDPALNPVPAFQINHVTTTTQILRLNRPVREVRFKGDGGVHDLFTINLVRLPSALTHAPPAGPHAAVTPALVYLSISWRTNI